MKWPLRDKLPALPENGSVGDFASRRSFYFHPGVDIYCGFGQDIQAIEDGEVIHIENFTGPNANPPSPWWLETWSILIEGAHGVLGYCEIKPLPHITIGTKVKEGECIATVVPVLKKDKGNGTTMLHFEHYEPGTRHHVTWALDTIKPEELKNSRYLLESLIDQ
jgi:murein DD-endopeptidase MepM/ murein hydrolase activator NlpD